MPPTRPCLGTVWTKPIWPPSPGALFIVASQSSTETMVFHTGSISHPGCSGNHVRASWGIYPCVDGFAGVCALERQIPAFFSVVGDPELQEPRFRDMTLRAENASPTQQRSRHSGLRNWIGNASATALMRTAPACIESFLHSGTALSCRGFEVRIPASIAF